MPRARGQIDCRKNDAILEAAAEVLAERGFGASIEELARRAKVSKQTIYNHFGSKTDLVRTLMAKRLASITAMIDEAPPGQRVQLTLTRYGEAILRAILSPVSVQLTRMAVVSAADMPEVAQAIYDAGARAAHRRLADYLREVGCQSLDIPDAGTAAEVFVGMVIGRVQTRLLMGLAAEIEPAEIPARAAEAAARFVRAYRRPPHPAESR